MSAANLQTFVGASDAKLPFVTQCFDEATVLVTDHIGVTETVPVVIKDRAVLEVGAELYHRQATKNGIAQFATTDGAPVRVARDPMVAARPILAPYLGLGIA